MTSDDIKNEMDNILIEICNGETLSKLRHLIEEFELAVHDEVVEMIKEG